MAKSILAKRNVDFTKGSVVKALIAFAVPLMLGEILQNMYQSVDELIVGNFVGENALAAVNVCGTVTRLVINFFNGMSVGTCVVVSKAFGSRDETRLADSMNAAYVFSVILGVVISVAGFLLAPVLLMFSDVPPGVHEEAIMYLRICLGGMMFTVIYNVSAGILRGCGDSRATFTVLLVSSAVNVVLDILFVAVFDFGVAGAAAATVTAQFSSVLICYRSLRRINREFTVKSPGFLKEKWDLIREMLKIGMPSGLQGCLISFSNLFVWRHISSFDSAAAIAGIGIAHRLDHFVCLPAKAFGMAMTTCTAQNIGAGDYKRADKSMLRCGALSLAFTVVISIVIYVMADSLAVLFNESKEISAICVDMMHTIIPFYFFIVFRELMMGTLRGYGKAKVTTVLGIIGAVGVRQLYLNIFMPLYHSLETVYYCYPIAWFASALLMTVYYIICRKKGSLHG